MSDKVTGHADAHATFVTQALWVEGGQLLLTADAAGRLQATSTAAQMSLTSMLASAPCA